ncbi:tolB protein precursor, periplasmic protein involved in the tonb-independent uptake of group A colicins [hydrothermal vent metagenome]|uniref:TolB protein, periplasmic protein involved in the tonb-independent uptake of group A colicins n=1 Tax=hydrothermal vent metagenome TaxID=652676 RepID=A0A3B1ANF8_9ZZZZ
MKNIKLTTKLSHYFIFLLLISLFSCGGGGSTAETNGQDTLITPVGDLSGDWQVVGTDSSATPSCNGVGFDLTVTISQSGNNLTVTNFRASTLKGIISGNTFSFSGSYAEGVGTTTITSSSSMISADCNQFTGNDSWSWADGTFICTGTSSYTGTRINSTSCTGGGQVNNKPIRLTSTASGGSSSPDMGADGMKIVFHSSPKGNNDIWIMDADGNNPLALTNTPENEGHAHLNSNSSQVVFWSERTGQREIWKMNSDGSGQTQLTFSSINNASNGGAAWSPDDTKIVFRSFQNNNDDIWIMDANGTNPNQITTNAANDSSPQFSPDGTQIVFTSTRAGNNDIWMMDVDGSNPVPLTTNAAIDKQPHFSADGTKIIFETNRAGNFDLWIMNRDGLSKTQITSNSANDTKGDFNSDASFIFFGSNRSGNNEIWTKKIQ